MRRLALALGAVAATGVAVVLLRFAPLADRSGKAVQAGAENAPVAHAPPDARAPATARPLPRSLRGTEVDGGLTVDVEGHFVPTPDAIALFHYFLAATGEESVAELRARIVAHLHGVLEGVAATEAIALLDRYLAFREDVRRLAEAGEPAHDLERRLQWLRELRREHFGAELAQVLFGEEERALAVDLERRRIARDPALDEETRALRLAALDADLPEDVRESRARASAPASVSQEVRTLRESGASDAEVFAVREARFGAEAAERLAVLDRERAGWEARLAAYRAERDALLADPGLADGPERDAELEALLRARFDENEARRVRALESAGALQGLPESGRRVR